MSDQTPTREGNANIHGLRALPDPKICRTTAIGEIKSFATCHVECPINCPHAISFGEGYFCKHPSSLSDLDGSGGILELENAGGPLLN
jgi:hypothetical protein